ncbi:MAG TPA: DNA mismatch repair endonuclease MutL, partial [Verrucomicrobiae bacterium]|nr:DNA mismatch repair endonuclease MutL [Verrucomicrobiae bacterium]
MNRIRLLPEQVANQIAAGEVVERPASVVKELVENALDAQATRITVEIQAGGRSLIRVTDDGSGMSRDDALLCLERHATSKIQHAEDLAAIATMGFRGEALPSIASVSRCTLTTRERDSNSPEGTQIVINGGKILEVKAAGSAPGTSIEARQLFFNLPARRKFLRTEVTEAAHVQHYLTLAALAFPEVAFTFQKDGRIVWQLPSQKTGDSVKERLTALRERLHTLRGDVKLLPVDFSAPFAFESAEPDGNFEQSAADNPKSAIRVWGLMGAPGVSRSTREDQHLFVNRRPVENRGLNFALLEGYHTALMKGRYPVCCLFLEIDPAAVDVNIHPAKREVKFHREGEVRKLVAQAVRDTLRAFHAQQSEMDSKRWGERPREPFADQPAGSPVVLPPKPGAPSVPAKRAPELLTLQLPEFPPPLQPIPEWPSRPAEPPPLQKGFYSPPVSTPAPGTQSAEHATRSTLPASTSPVPLLHVPLRLVGVIGKLYVVLESDRGLVLLDQHAAHERILFEQMLNRLEQNQQAPSQKLLLPETVELAARDAQFLREQLPALTRLGVGLGEFGERTFLLDALPPFVKVPDARRFVLDLVDELKAVGKEVNSARLG